jgi:hypothetical protein
LVFHISFFFNIPKAGVTSALSAAGIQELLRLHSPQASTANAPATAGARKRKEPGAGARRQANQSDEEEDEVDNDDDDGEGNKASALRRGRASWNKDLEVIPLLSILETFVCVF